MSRIRGCTDVAMAKCSRALHPRGVRPQRAVDRLAELGELDDLVDPIVDLVERDMPRARQPRRMLR